MESRTLTDLKDQVLYTKLDWDEAERTNATLTKMCSRVRQDSQTYGVLSKAIRDMEAAIGWASRCHEAALINRDYYLVEHGL